MNDNPLLSKEENEAIDRNLRGRDLEKQGNITDAIELYELNVAYGFEGDFPYDRLRVIYSKQKRYDDVIRVLEKAIDVFNNKVFADRPDRLPKLERFRLQLEKAKNLRGTKV
jgi:tetratricopeptide (TPR) repeat protein